jgi:hypothetical protein
MYFIRFGLDKRGLFDYLTEWTPFLIQGKA